MTIIEGIRFPDEEFTLQEIIDRVNKKKMKFRIVDTNKEKSTIFE